MCGGFLFFVGDGVAEVGLGMGGGILFFYGKRAEKGQVVMPWGESLVSKGCRRGACPAATQWLFDWRCSSYPIGRRLGVVFSGNGGGRWWVKGGCVKRKQRANRCRDFRAPVSFVTCCWARRTR